MSLRGVLAKGERMPAAELAREPRSLAVLAWFDGHAFGSGQGRRFEMPRRLDRHEAAAWREGFTAGSRERRCHEVHGFWGCLLPPGVQHAPGDVDWRYTPPRHADQVTSSGQPSRGGA